MTYEFTNEWFAAARNIWDYTIPQINPTKILEIGSYEGASACYLIENLAASKNIELHCVDSWEGGIEHKKDGSAAANMSEVEQRFYKNINTAITSVANNVQLFVYKSFSDIALAKLISQGKQEYFDFIYIDGSHQAPDVLCDAVLAFKLLKIGGVLAFDDYLWQEELPYGADLVRSPKLAIDSFTNIYCRKIRIISIPQYQVFIKKISN